MSSETDHPSRLLLWGRISLLTAASLALYQAGVAFSSTTPAGCGPDSGCLSVLTSRWAYSFGLPVSFAGVAAYAGTVFFSAAFVRRHTGPAGFASGVLIAAVLASAIWFSGIQYFNIGAFCLMCSTTHLLAVAGCVLLLSARMKTPLERKTAEGPGHFLDSTVAFRTISCAGGLACVGMLAVGSLQNTSLRSAAILADSVAASARSGNEISLFGGKVKFLPGDYPAIGQASTGSAVLLTDYTCHYCRGYQKTLTEATASAGRSVVMLPVSRTPEAEGIQRIMLTLFHTDKQKWQKLSDNIHNGTQPLELNKIAQAAATATGKAEWDAAVEKHQAKVDDQIKVATAAYEAASTENRRILPVLLNGDKLLSGAEDRLDVVTAFLKDGSLPATAIAAEALPHSAEEFATTPNLVLKSEIVDVGTVLTGTEVPATILFTNRGGRPLTITWCELEAGSRITGSPGPDTPIYPNRDAKIALTVKAPAAPGAFSRQVRIHSNMEKPALITIRGIAKSAAAPAPAAAITNNPAKASKP